MNLPPDTLRVLLYTLDERQIADTADDENIAVTLIGPKGWLVDFVATLATTESVEDAA